MTFHILFLVLSRSLQRPAQPLVAPLRSPDSDRDVMSWSRLPDDIWTMVLAYVALPQRLGSCSRVSKKLCRAAAAAATEQLELNFQRNPQRAEGAAQWLVRNGQHVTSLHLHGGDFTELPCPQLHQLVLNNGQVQLGPSSSHPGVLHSCTGLTKLESRSCRLVGGPDSLAALSAVPALQHLELSSNHSATDAELILPGSILQMLTQLTFLRLGIALPAEALQHISALQHLQVLDLFSPSVLLSPSSTPGLAQLTGLHTLSLSDASLDPAVLQHHAPLQRLKLFQCTFPGANSGAVLLSVIGQQLQLQQLNLTQVKCEWPTAAAAYTALTASSRLQELTLRLGNLPAGIWQAMFQPQQQLPHLTKLLCRWHPEDNLDVVEDPLAAAFSSTDISRLVACCPQVQDLNVGFLQADAQLAALSQLTALTALMVCNATESSVKSLLSLSQLKDLGVYVVPPCSPAALLHLTALRQLTGLEVWLSDDDGGDSDSDDLDPVEVYIQSRAVDDSTPDVWLQLLLEHCASISSCQPAVIRDLAQQLVEQQQLVSTQQQQIHELQQQNTQQQHSNTQQQQQINLQQQQIGQLQQQAADAVELRVQVAVLAQQVAQLQQALQHRG